LLIKGEDRHFLEKKKGSQRRRGGEKLPTEHRFRKSKGKGEGGAGHYAKEKRGKSKADYLLERSSQSFRACKTKEVSSGREVRQKEKKRRRRPITLGEKKEAPSAFREKERFASTDGIVSKKERNSLPFLERKKGAKAVRRFIRRKEKRIGLRRSSLKRPEGGNEATHLRD